jgi:hypothetical protein
MADEKMQQTLPAVEGATPLAAYANVAHEMFMEMQRAGFEPEDALAMTLELLPDWTFPLPDDWEWEDEDDADDEEDEDE